MTGILSLIWGLIDRLRKIQPPKRKWRMQIVECEVCGGMIFRLDPSEDFEHILLTDPETGKMKDHGVIFLAP